MTAERDRRWRLTLGEDSAEPSEGFGLSADDQRMDEALAALYGGGGRPGDGSSTEPRTGGLGGSAPRVATWLGDIRTYFPSSVVQVMQRDAIDRLGVRALLLEPELMESLEPDVHLVSTLISLGSAIPETSKATARTVVRTVVDDVERRIANRTRAAVTGALNRAARTRRPKLRDIDWNRTIAKNLKNYLPEQRTVVPERLVGYGRRQQHVERDIILAIDQSGSMAASVVYASIFGAVIASLRAVRTSLVVFDTAVVDLTEELSDPVELLFATQLGGGTDINRAIAYCQGLVTRPADTVFVLISDLFEGGVRDEMLARVEQLRDAGVVVVVLLALSDEGAPGVRPGPGRRPRRAGCPRVRVHPGRVPRPARGRPGARRHPGLGREAGARPARDERLTSNRLPDAAHEALQPRGHQREDDADDDGDPAEDGEVRHLVGLREEPGQLAGQRGAQRDGEEEQGDHLGLERGRRELGRQGQPDRREQQLGDREDEHDAGDAEERRGVGDRRRRAAPSG